MIPSLRKILNHMSHGRQRRNERLQRLRVKAKRRSFLEKLEDRHLMAALVVTNGNDSGVGSLRAAIEIANNNREKDTINFAEGVTEVMLTSNTLSLKESGSKNTTTIQGPIKISGKFGDMQKSVLFVGAPTNTNTEGVFAELSKVEITKGTFSGIRNFGHLEVRDSAFHENTGGPGLQSTGTLTVINSTFSNYDSGNSFGSGLEIRSGNATIINSTVTGNKIYGIYFLGGLDSSPQSSEACLRFLDDFIKKPETSWCFCGLT